MKRKRPIPPPKEIEQKIDSDGFLTFGGRYFKANNARLYTPPATNIPLYMAAIFNDGLITVSKPENSKEIFDIFDKYGLSNGKHPDDLENR